MVSYVQMITGMSEYHDGRIHALVPARDLVEQPGTYRRPGELVVVGYPDCSSLQLNPGYYERMKDPWTKFQLQAKD